MSRSLREYLKHIRDKITFLESGSTGIDKTEFLDDETHKRAFVRSIEIISRYLAQLVERQVTSRWPKGYFEEVVGGWQGVELIRPPQGDYEQRSS